MKATDGRVICPRCNSLDIVEHRHISECVACGHLFGEGDTDIGATLVEQAEVENPRSDPMDDLDAPWNRDDDPDSVLDEGGQ